MGGNKKYLIKFGGNMVSNRHNSNMTKVEMKEEKRYLFFIFGYCDRFKNWSLYEPAHYAGFKIIIPRVNKEMKEYFIFLKFMVDKGGIYV